MKQQGPVCYIDPNSPPSSYAVASALEGEPGAIGRVVGVTVLRSLFVAPGLLAAGIRGRPLVLGSLLGATGITAALFVMYALKRSKYLGPPNSAAPLGGLL